MPNEASLKGWERIRSGGHGGWLRDGQGRGAEATHGGRGREEAEELHRKKTEKSRIQCIFGL